jgi:hypothetical protein
VGSNTSDAVLGGGLAIGLGVFLLGVLGAGWAGWLRRGRLLQQGAAQQAFAGGFLGGPALILLGVLLLRTSGQGRMEVQAADVAMASAGLVMAAAATVIWHWKPRWLEPSWVRRGRDEVHRRQVEELLRHYGVDDASAPPHGIELDDLTGQFGVSGFDSVQAYDAREPTWTDDPFPSESEAVLAAERWLATQGAEAQVEVLRFVGRSEAEIVAVVTPGGIERIAESAG